MNIYYVIAILFGISGWMFSLYLWSRYKKGSEQSSKQHSQQEENQSKKTYSRASSSGMRSQPESPNLLSTKSDQAILPVKKDIPDDLVRVEAADEKRKVIVFGHAKPVLACLALLLAAALVFFIISKIGKNSGAEAEGATNTITVGDISFIKVVYTESPLPKPDWNVTTVKTIDSRGKEVEVILGVLSAPYKWVKADTHYVAIDREEKVRYKIEDIIKTFQDDEKRPIIVVGLASHENVKENPEEEIDRAADRADKLAALCSEHFKKNKPHIYSLNIGGFKPNNNTSMFSATERRVVLLVINQGEDTPDLTAEVKKALIKASQEQNFILDARDYSLFNTDRFRVTPMANF